MKNVDPHQIPEDGVRQDITLLKIGYLDLSDNHPKIVVVGLIDNGPYKGKRVSHSFRPTADADPWVAFQIAIDCSHGDPSDKKLFLQPFQDVSRTGRFSAIVHTDWFTNARGTDGVQYSLSDFEEAKSPCRVKFKKTEFVRNHV